MTNSRIGVRLPAASVEKLDEYCQDQNLSRSEAIRIAVERLSARPASKKEREKATVPAGRPPAKE